MKFHSLNKPSDDFQIIHDAESGFYMNVRFYYLAIILLNPFKAIKTKKINTEDTNFIKISTKTKCKYVYNQFSRYYKNQK